MFHRWALWGGLLALMFLGRAAPAAPGDIFYVNRANASGVENGLSWATAYTRIQDGIERARSSFGGEVWVAEGIYDEERDNAGSLRLRPTVQLYGGFLGTEITRNQRNPLQNVTVIDGSRSNAGAPAAGVVLGAADALIDGFTIRGGRAERGAGMLNLSVAPVVVNCVFSDNIAEDFGGAVLNFDEAAPRFIDCVFTGNQAGGSGAAVGNVAGSPVFEGCTFSSNIAQGAGAAIFNTMGSDILVRNCVFSGNEAEVGGAAIFNDGAIASLEGCEFYNNTTPGYGGALFNNVGADCLAVNCVFARNVSDSGGAAISNLESSMTAVNCTIADNISLVDGSALFNNQSTMNALNCIIWYNTHNWVFNFESVTSIRWSNVGGGDPGPENIAYEPRFVDRAANNYHLQPNSPCVDAGTADGAPSTDLEGTPRPQGAAIDMGAYEVVAGSPELPDFQCPGITLATQPPKPGNGTIMVFLALLGGFVMARPAWARGQLRD